MHKDDFTPAPDKEHYVTILLPLALPLPLSYAVPADMTVSLGDYVEVPLAARTIIGVVWSVHQERPAVKNIRTITRRFDLPPLPLSVRKLIDWTAAYYLDPPGALLRMVLRAPGIFALPKEHYHIELGDHLPQSLSAKRQSILEKVKENANLSIKQLAQTSNTTPALIKDMIKAGILKSVISLATSNLVPIPRAAITNMPMKLSDLQEEAAQKLRDLITMTDTSISLLDGVTGSGKTEVYFEAMAHILAQGKQVLLLLPEIALTDFFLSRIAKRFGLIPPSWHSAMSKKARETVWLQVATGQAVIVVGARSALFLPWKNLGLIIVDEEHESAYKQEEGVAYHARDVAVLYGKIGKFPIILSSATPSLETLVNCERGRYHLIKLPDRYGQARLPRIDLIDMRQMKLPAGKFIAPPLEAALSETLAAGDQALLFLNRRGFAPLTLCRTCGHHLLCPHCVISLVAHRFRGILLCHYCGHQEPSPEICPNCKKSDTLVACGPGVERLAEEIQILFPQARMTILSSDHMQQSNLSHILQAIADQHYDFIIGTQLAAKGYHFPHLTLVGAVDGDFALETSDPRAGERTFALLGQVSGRAGRSEKPGRALIQTYMPHHPLMQALACGNRDDYLALEKNLRATTNLPPYGRLASLIISGPALSELIKFAHSLARAAPGAEGLCVLGPAPAPIALIRGRHRYRFLIKAQAHIDLQAYLRQWLGPVNLRGGLKLTIDIDPYNFS